VDRRGELEAKWFETAVSHVYFIGAAIAPNRCIMTLTFLLTVLAVWFAVSVPAALVIARVMRVQAEGGDHAYCAEVEPAYRRTA
jgi:hypothetical protein